MENNSSPTLQQAFDQAVQVLQNTQAGWVNRRDAAEVLGFIATRARTALEALRNDADVDVRAAVEKALAQSGTLSGTPPLTPKSSYTLEELARACKKDNARIVTAERDNCYLVTVMLKNERRQTVHVATGTSADGRPIVRVYTPCGPARDDLFAWALRSNSQLTNGAIVLEGEGAEARFILQASYAMSDATPALIKSAVKELAIYGDWLEHKLSGTDDL